MFWHYSDTVLQCSARMCPLIQSRDFSTENKQPGTWQLYVGLNSLPDFVIKLSISSRFPSNFVTSLTSNSSAPGWLGIPPDSNKRSEEFMEVFEIHVVFFEPFFMVLILEVFFTFAIGIESVIRYSCKLLSNRKALFLTCKWRILITWWPMKRIHLPWRCKVARPYWPRPPCCSLASRWPPCPGPQRRCWSEAGRNTHCGQPEPICGSKPLPLLSQKCWMLAYLNIYGT